MLNPYCTPGVTCCCQSEKGKHKHSHKNTKDDQLIINGLSTLIRLEEIPITQCDIPLTINKSGKYRLIEDITYNCSGVAITISSSSVSLNLGNYNIISTNAGITSILISNVSDIEITNDLIINQGNNGIGVYIRNSNTVTINGVTINGPKNGILVENSQNIKIINSSLLANKESGIKILASDTIDIINSTFIDNNNGLTIDNNSKNVNLTGSKFINSVVYNLLANQINGLVIDNSVFSTNGNGNQINLVQLGNVLNGQNANDVIITNSTFINQSFNHSLEGLYIANGSGYLIQNNIFDIDNSNTDITLNLSSLHISNPGIVSNVKILNNVFNGSPQNSIYADIGSVAILIQNNLIEKALKNGLLLTSTTSSVIDNNVIQYNAPVLTTATNANNGILLVTSTNNTIRNNVVNNNPNGIVINATSANNNVQNNTVYSNTMAGITDNGTNNKIYNNIAYNNATNYVGVTLVATPGTPVTLGVNLSA